MISRRICRRLVAMAFAVGALLPSGCSRQETPGPKAQSEASKPDHHRERPDDLLETYDPETTLVTINERPISREMYEKQAFYYSLYSGLKTDSHEERLQALIEAELLYQEALRLKLDRQPHIRRQIQQLLINNYLEHEARAKEQEPITEELLQKSYDRNYAKYNEPTSIRISHILIAADTDTARKQAREKAEATLKEALGTRTSAFYELARKYSDDKDSAIKNGDLGWVEIPDPHFGQSHAPWQVKLIDAALSVKQIGNICPNVVETEKGFHIVKYNGIRKGKSYPFSAVREKISRELRADTERRTYQDLVAKLRQNAAIVVNEGLFKTIRRPVDPEEVVEQRKEKIIKELETAAEARKQALAKEAMATANAPDIEVIPLPAEVTEMGNLTIQAIPRSDAKIQHSVAKPVISLSPVASAKRPSGKGTFITEVKKETKVLEQDDGQQKE